MMTPTVHLNGTSGEALRDQNLDAMSALSKAVRALNEAAPNARDYYVQGDHAFTKARAEHENRVARINSVIKELEEVVEGIQTQLDAREAHR